ncbi:MAG: hypothetical protein WD826_01905, partial [Actinomycetota bacterium]
LVLLPLAGADAKKGQNNAGGSDRADEVRQNDGNNGGGKSGGNNNGGSSDGTGTPDDGDNMHPSGNDKSVEPGGSYPQGNSPSDPDGMSNGGADKPGGAGGVDLDDQDGNNGCGNDDDFEDDNNGNCGGLKEEAPETETDAEPVEMSPEAQPFALRSIVVIEPAFREVLSARPTVVVEPEGEALSATQIEPAVAVAGVAEEADSSVAGGGTGTGLLPLTGSAIEAIVILAVSLMILGSVVLGATRRFTPRSG